MLNLFQHPSGRLFALQKLIAKHVFYFAREMPIYIGMTAYFISLKQPGHAEFISASHQNGNSLYR
ncbi:hypothetical protein [Mucilaginibacter sp.]|jgi:hypothetical protein|uniref:hypothetical protein n=1 Tax=Mucilaginibacter sp. TaxID=1882438 RepID=UPI003564276D